MQLTATQSQIIEAALTHPQALVAWFPDHIHGGARSAILRTLVGKGLLTEGSDGYRLTDLAYRAMGAKPASLFDDTPNAACETPQEIDEFVTADTEAVIPRSTKQRLVIAMLERADGASISEICEATGWLPHTVRGTFAGVLKKKLGMQIESRKDAQRGRVYQSVKPFD